MLGPRRPRYPLLQAYLATRPNTPLRTGGDRNGLSLVAVMGLVFVGLGLIDGSTFLMGIGLALAAVFGVRAWRARPPAPPTPEEVLARQADGVAHSLRAQARSNRLHRALHPGVAATLEECAAYQGRIAAALEGWSASPLRDDALIAAKVAMDDALVHAGTTLAYVLPPRPMDSVSDALEDIGLGGFVKDARGYEPMPPSFLPVRDLAERLRELAVRCETAASERRQEEPEAVSPAFRRLDAALGEMRGREAAEEELRQQA